MDSGKPTVIEAEEEDHHILTVEDPEGGSEDAHENLIVQSALKLKHNFWKPEVRYVGHVLKTGEKSLSPERLQTIKECP